jgi:RimJ/RimL family protein N-acetyltransferase
MNPIIETERLFIREILPTDVNGFYALDSDPKVHRYLGNNPVTDKSQVVEIINSVRQQYVDFGIGRWAIIDKKTNDFIGWTGLKFVTNLTNNHINFYDIGYRLKRKYWGQGIATETAVACLAYAFDNLNLEVVYASASIENIASNTILKKIGLNFIETYYYKDIKCNWYRIMKSEYQQIKINI